MKPIRTVLFASLLTGCASAGAPAVPVQYEVILLVGQSNMSGRGQGADSTAPPVDPRVLAWDARRSGAEALVPARDPLVHQDLGQRPVAVGPALSFAHAFLATLPAQRKVVLVPAAFGGTGFSDTAGSWRVGTAPVSPLASEALARTNAVLRQLGPSAHFAGILWHQGETDGGNGLPPERYSAELDALIAWFRANIDGGAAAPVVVGQYVPRHLAEVAAKPASTLARIAATNVGIAARVPNSACVDSAGLEGNVEPDQIHFNAASQRELGRRYASALIALREHQRSETGCSR